jgi:hypothetical protein
MHPQSLPFLNISPTFPCFSDTRITVLGDPIYHYFGGVSFWARQKEEIDNNHNSTDERKKHRLTYLQI